MSVRHCPATTAPRNFCPNCYAEQSHKDNVRSSAVGKQLKGEEGERDTYRYTVTTTRMIPALRWAAMRAILKFK